MSANIESRSARRERHARGHAQKASRSKYDFHVNETNRYAIKYAFANSRFSRSSRRRADLRTNNPDEAQAPASKWAWSTIILIALVAVVVIDYLIIGGTLDYLLGMQRELQGLEQYYVYLKIFGTFALLTLEIAIAIGLVLLRERTDSRLPVFLHWVVGIGMALALTGFAFGLMYTKIRNESVNIPVAEAADVVAPLTAVAEVADAGIPLQKWVLLAGLCSVCFFVHIFALMKADSVADAFSLAAYGVGQAHLAGQETIHRLATNRAAGKTENSYRRAYDQFEAHMAEFPGDPLPSVPGQQDPNQRIPIMRLSPVAQRIIESLQNGAVENLNAAAGTQARQPQPPNEPVVDASDVGDDNPPPIDPPAASAHDGGNGFHSNQYDGNAANGNAGNSHAAADVNGDANRHDADNGNSNNPDAAEADYLRTILEAQVRNSDGEI